MHLSELMLLEAKETFYHGSSAPIGKFHLEAAGGKEAIDQEGPGIYLTSSIEDARRYGKHVHTISVKLVKSRMMPDKRKLNPEWIRVLMKRAPESEDTLTNWGENPAQALNAAVDSIMDSYGPSEYRKALEQIWYDFYKGHEQVWFSKMRVAGWDGFIVNKPSDGVKHLICFNPDILEITGVVDET